MAQLNHLHLHVRDIAVARRFYEGWFGLKEQVWHGDILFLRDDAGLDLALAPDPSPAEMPAWFHLGFRLPTRASVRNLHARMKRKRAGRPSKLYDEPDLVHFRVRDPDGVPIDVYWE